MELLDCLIETGLTRHEAQLYLLLCSEGAMSGYEAAKQSGMSRSNAYMALAGLSGKGAVMDIDGDVRRYAAVAPADYCRIRRSHSEQVLATILESMPQQKEIAEPFLTIKGQGPIIAQMKNLVSQARHRLYAALAADELQAVLPELTSQCAAGLKVVLITAPPFRLPGTTVYHAVKQPGQIRLIVDSTIVLTGEINAQGESSCLFSRHKALVDLFKESMMNEIRLLTAANGSPASPATPGGEGEKAR
jgi:HTH-type transcriptional regulator, sugar sensing transcriptional regulator